MDSYYSAPETSGDPSAELTQLIQRSVQLQEEALAISHRIKELHQQISQQRDAANDLASSELRAQGNR